MTDIHNQDLYVVIVFDNRYLFIPQDHVQSIEIIADVQQTNDEIGIIGWFFRHHLESPVFNLAKNFSLTSVLSKKCEYFILLKDDEQPLGITCDEVDSLSLKQAHLFLQATPISMKTPNSPISKLLIYQDKIAYVSTGNDLKKYLLTLHQDLIGNIK
ncbi:MAG: hypothetical protein KAH84_11920 [Thiomargarita sp.]|nr:hypothetical protein [Thiomargarita sp.]